MPRSGTDSLELMHVRDAGSSARQRMPVADSPRDLLFDVLGDPRRLSTMDLATWDVLLRAARAAGVLPHLVARADRHHALDNVPGQVEPHLTSARVLARRQRVAMDWEIGRIGRALAHLATPIVLLKGAAYQAIGLTSASGRMTDDIDILVARERLADVEQALLAAGWEVATIDARDEAYFRRWLHELPPLQHRRRRTLIDVHHTILPRTDRLRLDPAVLIAASVPLRGRRLRVLAPVDMFLHSAAHLFRNGHWSNAVRDLVDMDAMLREFGAENGFSNSLVRRAEELDLRIPCAAALRALEQHLGTPLPKALADVTSSSGWRYRWPLGALLDRLVERALFPRSVDRLDRDCDRARAWLAYWPVPRLQAMRTTLFWTKRIPRKRRTTIGDDANVQEPGGHPAQPDA